MEGAVASQYYAQKMILAFGGWGGAVALRQTPPRGGVRLRPQITESWRRSRLSGLAPDLDPGVISIADIDSRSRLMATIRPVLSQLPQQLGGTRLCVLKE